MTEDFEKFEIPVVENIIDNWLSYAQFFIDLFFIFAHAARLLIAI